MIKVRRYFPTSYTVLLLILLSGCGINSVIVQEPTTSRFNEAMDALQSDNPEVAIVILKELHSTGYNTANVWSAIARAHQLNHQLVLAVAIAYKLLSYSPRSPSIQNLFDSVYLQIEGEPQSSIWTVYHLWHQLRFITFTEHLLALLAVSILLLIMLVTNQRNPFPKGILIAVLAVQFVVLLSFTLRLYLETMHPIAIYTDTTSLPVHSSSAESAPTLFEITSGTLFYTDRVDGEWIKVVTYYGRHGWISTTQFELLRRIDVYSQ